MAVTLRGKPRIAETSQKIQFSNDEATVDLTKHGFKYDTVEVEGANLKFWHGGSGPLLVMIPGGGGVGARFNPVAMKMAKHYTVASYDRRACSGSTGDIDRPMNPYQQAEDLAAVIRAVGYAKASIFGNSVGGTIALEFAARFPDMCEAVVAHEAPTMSILPDSGDQFKFTFGIEKAFSEHGQRVAGRLMHARHRGLDEDPQWVFKQSNNAKTHEGGIPNGDFFFGKEMLVTMVYTPDLFTLRHNGVPVALGCGAESRKDPTGRCTFRQAEILAAPHVLFPGHHLVFLYDFSDVLLHTLATLRALPRLKFAHRALESKL
ncbi:MAG: hypothetical protein M4579_004469 [Chaenotheca gracillima]|nr:MAG: hypothetical protein M4579_004469 [Chaenotheca gracillima]